MKVLGISFFLIALNLNANEVITETDRFFDTKTEKYVYVCEQNNGELIAKESCGKYWKAFPRKREQLIKEVQSYKELEKNAMVMFPVKKSEGNTKMVLGRVSRIYENGRVDVMEYYTKRFGINPGTLHYSTKYIGVTKLQKDHPMLKHGELCLKEDNTINYNYGDDRKYPLKKGDRVALKAVFENGIAAISINSFSDKLLGYGFENQLPISISKLQECDGAEKSIVDDTSRNNSKPKDVAGEEFDKSIKQNALTK